MNALLGTDAYALEQETPIELRILHGAQEGSRICLSPGEYLLGRDDSCTLILEGHGIEDQHAVLRFDGAAAWIDPVQGFVRNAHGDDITEELELTFGLPVELGSVWISVDKEDAPWPDPRSVMPINSGQVGKNEEVAPEPDPVETTERSGGTSAPVDRMFTPPAKKRSALAYGLTLIFVLLVGGLVIASMAALETTEHAQAITPAVTAGKAETTPSEEVLAVLRDYPDATLKLENEDGAWIVRGFLPTAVEQQELSGKLASVAPAIQLQIKVEEELLQGARRLLSVERAAQHVKVESASAGVVRLTGAVVSAAEVERLKQLLLRGVGGISDVKSEILTAAPLRKQFRERLAAAGLADRLAVTSEEPELTLVGRLTMDEIRRWEDLVVSFNRDYGNVLPIRATVSRLVPKPPVGVQAIVGGAVPYIVTPTGEHVNQGGDVNGHTLVSIKDGEVVFEGRQRVRIAR